MNFCSTSIPGNMSSFQPYNGMNQFVVPRQFNQRVLHKVTTQLQTIHIKQHQLGKQLRRYLINPNQAMYNDGQDNEQFDLIVRVGDEIINDKANRTYILQDNIGQGTFGHVYSCIIHGTTDKFAMKIIKNQDAYSYQAIKEIKILKLLNKYQSNADATIVSIVDYFYYKSHVCIVFPLLKYSLYDWLTETKCMGLSIKMIKSVVKQVLNGLVLIHRHKFIHCDIKLENILFSNNNQVQIIDFGSACEESFNSQYYIQSLLYRAPEVILGIPKTNKIDVWSLGCVAAELYLGYPLFQCTSSYDLLSRIQQTFHDTGLNRTMIEQGSRSDRFFNFNGEIYQFKTKEQFEIDEGVSLPQSNKFVYGNLSDLMTEFDKSQFRQYEEMSLLKPFIEFLSCLLVVDPTNRISAADALLHPFLQENQFNIMSILGNHRPETQKHQRKQQ